VNVLILNRYGDLCTDRKYRSRDTANVLGYVHTLGASSSALSDHPCRGRHREVSIAMAAHLIGVPGWVGANSP